MLEIMAKSFWPVVLASLILPFPIIRAQDKAIVQCKSERNGKKQLSYESGLKFRSRPERGLSSTAVVQVYVKPDYVNATDLVTLAAQFKRDFCKEDDLMVSLFTDRRYIDGLVIPGLWGYKGGYEAAANTNRGYYLLKRTAGEEYISFSSVPNYDKHPESRTRIDLTKPPR